MLAGTITWAEIDLDAIAYNLQAFRRHVGNSVEIIAVVKANAYGHGAVPVAQAALEAGANRLAVHRLVEAIELRSAGIEAPILLMGYTPPDAASMITKARLTPSVTTLESARAFSRQAQRDGVIIPVHIKVDTGMSRYGLMPEEIIDFAEIIHRLPGIYLEGLFTHFATADWLDQSFTHQQLDVFKRVLKDLLQSHIEIPLVHAANSAALASLPEAHFDAVRPGLSLYGLPASTEWPMPFDLHPALTLKSRLVRLCDLPAGSAVSYGRTYIADHPIRAALVPVGYGDGYPRILSNRACVLVHGKRVTIIGRICMDQFVIDISQIPGAQQDDEVVLIGHQGEDTIQVRELADLASTIQYEIVTSLSRRIVRVYMRQSIPVAVTALGNLE